MQKVSLTLAAHKDKPLAIALDYALDKDQHIILKREEKITKAISGKECFIIHTDSRPVGFVIFDYRFFDQGWIELIIIDENERGKGIAGQVFDLICNQCTSEKVFTSTNQSNLPMQRALAKSGFTFAGKLDGLDEGDPELFYYRKTETAHTAIPDNCNESKSGNEVR